MRAKSFHFLSIAVVALSVSATLTACGSDTEITGPQGLLSGNGAGNDATGSLDGTSGADSTWSADSTWPSDSAVVAPDSGTPIGGPDDGIVVPPDQSCKNRCGKYSPNWACQCDTICVKNNNCCPDIQQVCGTTPIAKCGDGQCTPPETANSCPMDCKTGGIDPGVVKGCLEKSCPGEFSVCAGDPQCGKVLECAVSCTTNSCLNKCAQGANIQVLQKTLIPLLQCGDQSGCYGSVTPPAPVCGDGQCTSGETGKSCPQDCGTTPMDKCGDGICTGMENAKNCAKDCAGTTTKCGDGQCIAPESQQSCPQDCGGGTIDPGQIVVCLEKACGSEYKTCLADASCAKVISCAKSCTTLACVEGCATASGGGGGMSSALVGIAQCGQQAGCFEGSTTPPVPVCGDGQCNGGETGKSCPQDCGPTPSKCGDGMCDKTTETSVNCTADCKPTNNPTSLCVQKYCTDAYKACGQTAACFNAVNCIGSGGNPQQCFSDPTTAKLASALLQCGQQAGCFGGSTTNSCQGKCGQPPAPGQTCGCDAYCAQMGNCCPDYKSLCGTQPPVTVCGDGVCASTENSKTCPIDCGPPKPVCGDGICAPNYESSKTCPIDCGGPPQVACKSKADCAADEVCCIQSAGQVCVKIGSCN